MVLASIAIPSGISVGYFLANGIIKKLLLMDQFDVGGFNLVIIVSVLKLTYANISRNKKRTVITLLSLGLSGILFITMSTVLKSMSVEELATRHMAGDFELALDNFTLIDDEVQETDANILKENGVLGKEIQE